MNNEDPEFKKLVENLSEMAKQQQLLAKQAVALYEPIVHDIIFTKNKDKNHIERTLDYMLDFCFDDDMLLLYKKLCRYYYYIDERSTIYYVHAYRDMWDEEYLNQKENNSENEE